MQYNSQSLLFTKINMTCLSIKPFGTVLLLGSRSNLSSHPTRQINVFEHSKRLERYRPTVFHAAHDSCAYPRSLAIVCYTYVTAGSIEMVRNHDMQTAIDPAPYNTRI